MQGPPNIDFPAEMLALPKTKGGLWLARPGLFWLQPFPKGEVAPRVPLGTPPVLNVPGLELLSGPVPLTPESPQSIGVTNPPKAKGGGAVLPNTEPQATFWCVWATTPKPVLLAWPEGTPATVLPKFGQMPAGRGQAEAKAVKPPEGDFAVLLKAG